MNLSQLEREQEEEKKNFKAKEKKEVDFVFQD